MSIKVNFESAETIATKFQNALGKIENASAGSVEKSPNTELSGNNQAIVTYAKSQDICKVLIEGLRADIANLQTVAAEFKATEEKAKAIIENNSQGFKNPLDEVLGHD